MNVPRQSITPTGSAFLMLIALIGGLTQSGCVSVPSVATLLQRVPVADAQNPVMDLVCVWQQGEGRTPEGIPCRGFCGQFLFVSARSPVPARVNGVVKVYVFDDVGTPEEQKDPYEVFEFTPQQWATFAHKTNIGMTYQLFIPYTRQGVEHASCQLRVRFTPADGGPPIYSQAASISLEAKTGSQFVGEERVVRTPIPRPVEDEQRSVQSDLAQKYVQDSRQPAPPMVGSPPIASIRSTTAELDRQRLESALDRAIGRGVEHAGYSAPAGATSGVRRANGEDLTPYGRY